MNLSADRRRALTEKAQRYAANVELAMPYLLSRGISREVADMFGLGYCNEGMEAGSVTIPYATPAGVVQIKYRVGAEGRKYVGEAGCGVRLFNAQVLIHAVDQVVLTEGELDAICVQAYCGVPAVSYPGVDTWNKQQHWRHCFEGVADVVVVADGDKVGREAARRVAESIGGHARVVDLGDGEDSNSYLTTHGASSFLEKAGLQ